MSEKSEQPAVYFLRLDIENVRCFGPRQVLDLSDGQGQPAMWTVLLGENGTGKTTLLEWLCMAEPIEGQGLPEGARWWQPNFRAHRENHQREPEPSYLDGIWWTSGEKISFSAKLHAPKAGIESQEVSVAPLNVPPPVALIAYGATRRTSDSALTDEEHHAPLKAITDPSHELRNPEEWLLRLDYLALSEGEGSESRKRLEQVVDVLVHLLPDVQRITIQAPRERKTTSLKGAVRFHTEYGEVPLSRLSLGYQTLMAWVVDLAAQLFDRYPDSPDPLTEPAVVLVDEVDLHLHPRWQRDLVGYLRERFPKVQFIVTAHSPLVVQASRDENLVVLRREGDHVVIDNDPKVVAGWRADQLLTSDLFGLPSARPPDEEALLRRRRELVEKRRRTPEEVAELAELDARVRALSTAETAEDHRAMDLIREAASLLAMDGE